MRKRIATALLVALTALLGLAVPALAWGGETTDVSVSPITITGNTNVGQTVTLSGTVTVTSSADAGGAFFAAAYADSNAYFSVDNPNATTVASGSNSQSQLGFGGFWVFPASADASQTYGWSADVVLDQYGYWQASQGGDANALWFTIFPFGGGGDSASGGNFLMFYAFPGNPGMIPPDGWVTFELNTMGYEHFFDWVEPKWDEGKTLAEDACAEFAAGGEQYRICIPKGTEITGWNGAKISSLSLFYCRGEILFSPAYVWFSQASTLSQMVNGEWTAVATFEQISGGRPVE